MIFLQNRRSVIAALSVALLALFVLIGGCSTTTTTSTAPTTPTNATTPTAAIPIDLRTQDTQSTSAAANDGPSFSKIVDAKHNQGLCLTASMHTDVLSQVNQFRAKGAVCGGISYPPAKPLRWSTKLQQAADKHAHDMATHNFFNHKSASNGSTLIERLHSVGYNYSAAGENIGAGSATVTQVIDMWATSPAHCVILMTAHFVELGVSCRSSSSSRYKTYWTLKAAAPS